METLRLFTLTIESFALETENFIRIQSKHSQIPYFKIFGNLSLLVKLFTNTLIGAMSHEH